MGNNRYETIKQTILKQDYLRKLSENYILVNE